MARGFGYSGKDVVDHIKAYIDASAYFASTDGYAVKAMNRPAEVEAAKADYPAMVAKVADLKAQLDAAEALNMQEPYYELWAGV